jgi:hypothetical protein
MFFRSKQQIKVVASPRNQKTLAEKRGFFVWGAVNDLSFHAISAYRAAARLCAPCALWESYPRNQKPHKNN